jgi:hypothetical protein
MNIKILLEQEVGEIEEVPVTPATYDTDGTDATNKHPLILFFGSYTDKSTNNQLFAGIDLDQLGNESMSEQRMKILFGPPSNPGGLLKSMFKHKNGRARYEALIENLTSMYQDEDAFRVPTSNFGYKFLHGGLPGDDEDYNGSYRTWDADHMATSSNIGINPEGMIGLAKRLGDEDLTVNDLKNEYFERYGNKSYMPVSTVDLDDEVDHEVSVDDTEEKTTEQIFDDVEYEVYTIEPEDETEFDAKEVEATPDDLENELEKARKEAEAARKIAAQAKIDAELAKQDIAAQVRDDEEIPDKLDLEPEPEPEVEIPAPAPEPTLDLSLEPEPEEVEPEPEIDMPAAAFDPEEDSDLLAASKLYRNNIVGDFDKFISKVIHEAQ